MVTWGEDANGDEADEADEGEAFVCWVMIRYLLSVKRAATRRVDCARLYG